ncbi:MAG: PaaI family thioesterase [Micromonosporaceae bacterium]
MPPGVTSPGVIDNPADPYANLGNPIGLLAEKMGIQLLEAAPDRVVGIMPVAGNVQPYGLLHGGASCVLAETLGSTGAHLHAMPDGYAVGLELNATHHRSATSGVVTGVATALRLGRTVATYEIVMRDDADRRVCTARLTCMIRPRNEPAEHRDRPGPR